MSLILNKLSKEDIDQKIKINEENGVNIYKLKSLIKEEMKDFQWVAIRANVQVQFYQEQLDRIEEVIKERSLIHSNKQ